MKNSKARSKKTYLVCSIFYLIFSNAFAMERTPVQEHLDWLDTTHSSATADATRIINGMCRLSKYLGDYKGFYFLRKSETALEQLSKVQNTLEKISSNIIDLSSNKNEQPSITAYKALTAWQSEQAVLSKAWNACSTLQNRSLLFGQNLASAFDYVIKSCSALEDSLKKNDAQISAMAMHRLSYNIELLFIALYNKKALKDFVSNSRCVDNLFLEKIQNIINSYNPPIQRTAEEKRRIREKEKSYADWIKSTFTSRIEVLTEGMNEASAQADISFIARLLLKPKFHEKYGISLAEKSELVRGLMGSNGTAIGKAVAKEKPITGIISDLDKFFPPAFKPLTLSLLNSYGKTIVNPLIYLACLSRFPLAALKNRFNLATQDLEKRGALPSFEEQLYPYLAKMGSVFYKTIQDMRKIDFNSVPTKFEGKYTTKDDLELLKRREQLEQKYNQKRKESVETQERYLQFNEKLKNADLEKKFAHKKNLKNKYKELKQCKQKERNAEELKKIDAQLAINQVDRKNLANAIKLIKAKIQEKADLKKNIKMLKDECLLLEKKKAIVLKVLEQRGYQVHNFQETAIVTNPKIGDYSFHRLNVGKEMLDESISLLKKRLKAQYDQLHTCQRVIQQDKDLVEKIQKGTNRSRELKEEINFFLLQKEKLEKKINKKKEKIREKKDEREEYNIALQKKESDKKRLSELRDFLNNNYLQNLFARDTLVTPECFRYLEGLVMENQKEFFKITKKFYKKNSNLNLHDVQNVFNAWLIYLLDRQKDCNKEKLRTGYEEILYQIEKAKNKTKAECENYSKKHIREVWSSYTLSMRVAAWFNFFRKGRFPIYTTQYKSMLKSQESLYQQCFEKYQALKNKGSFKFLQETDQNEALLHVRQEQRVSYNLIKFLLDPDDSKSVSYCLPELPNKSPKKVVQESNKDERNIEFVRKKVALQSNADAECGYHALYNALKAVDKNNNMTLHDFIKACKGYIRQKRNSYDDQWLTEEEIRYLQKKFKAKMSILFMPDVTRYYKGKDGLNLKLVNAIAAIHENIDKHENFLRAYVVSITNEDNSWNTNESYNRFDEFNRDHTHWIAIIQNSEDGQFHYEIADSLGDSKYKELERQFEHLMHDNRNYKKIEKKESEKRKDWIKNIEFSKALSDGFYALHPNSKISDNGHVIINEPSPNILIDRILEACVALFNNTNGEEFHNCMGHIKPCELIKKAVIDIKNKDNGSIFLHNHLNEPGTKIDINLSEGQKQVIEALEQKISE